MPLSTNQNFVKNCNGVRVSSQSQQFLHIHIIITIQMLQNSDQPLPISHQFKGPQNSIQALL